MRAVPLLVLAACLLPLVSASAGHGWSWRLEGVAESPRVDAELWVRHAFERTHWYVKMPDVLVSCEAGRASLVVDAGPAALGECRARPHADGTWSAEADWGAAGLPLSGGGTFPYARRYAQMSFG